jgi:MerR family transcriptional regulator, heat shock protein HspR
MSVDPNRRRRSQAPQQRRTSATPRVVGGGLDRRRAVFMISVAAELAEMHPQTLRMYEARGLISPKRSPKNTRLYSYDDVERLRRIQQMTADEGLNLAGVETVLVLERELEKAREEVARMRERAAELERKMTSELERVRRSLRAEIVPYGAYDPPGLISTNPTAPGRGAEEAGGSVSIPIERKPKAPRSDAR